MRRRQPAQGARAKQRSRPGTEVLAGEFLAGDPLEIGVHVGGLYGARGSVLIEVLEQLLARQVLHAAHELRDAAVGERNFVRHAALSLEAQAERDPLAGA